MTTLTLLTVNEVAAKLNVKSPTLREWINQGWVPGGCKPGGGRVHRFNSNVIDQWIEAGCPRPLKRAK
jgi:excisionase family DNA binding protein